MPQSFESAISAHSPCEAPMAPIDAVAQVMKLNSRPSFLFQALCNALFLFLFVISFAAALARPLLDLIIVHNDV